MDRYMLPLATFLVGAVLFVTINVISGAALRSMRLDLTEDELYTLSDGAKSIATSIDEPVRLYLYYSEEQASKIPQIKTYGTRVKELLEEFVIASDGQLELELIDPEPFSEAEDAAQQAGLQPLRGQGDPFYFGLVGSGSTDEQEIIPFFNPERERFLEYEVAQLIYTLGHPDKPVIGLVSSLPLRGSARPQFPGAPPASEPWLVMTQLTQFEVRDLGTDFERVPADVDLLWIVHPKSLGAQTRFAIDQHVLGGGNALVMLDPMCEQDQPPPDPQNHAARFGAEVGSDLPELLGAWGLELVADKVVGDREGAAQVNWGGQIVRHVLWPQLGEESLDDDDPTVSELSALILASAGALKVKPGSTTEVTTLVRSSSDSMLIDQFKVQLGVEPPDLIRDFVPSGEEQIFAARVSGKASTAFPDGAPAPAPDPAAPEGTAPQAPEPPPGGWLTESQGPINVIVIADCDFLADSFWIRAQRLGNIVLGYQKTADNGDFVVNALDNLSGSSDLISIRGRGRFTRPFDRVDAIRAEAEERFLREQEKLEQKLVGLDEKIAQLQSEKAEGEGAFILSPAQIEALDEARAEKVETRKDLREVQHQLQKDIEGLGTSVKVINIALIPLLVIGAGMALWLLRLLGRRQQVA